MSPVSPRTLIRAIRNSIGAKCRILLQGKVFAKFGPINDPPNVVRSFLNTLQKIFQMMMPRTLNACLESRSNPRTHKAFSLIHLRFTRMTVNTNDSVETKQTFLDTPSTESKSAFSQRIVFLRLCPSSASRFERFSRVRLAMIWPSPWKSMHSKEVGSKHFRTRSHALHNRISVPRCQCL